MATLMRFLDQKSVKNVQNRLAKMEQSFAGTAGHLQTVSDQLVGKWQAAMTGIGGLAINSAAQVEAASSSIQVSLGVSEQEAQKLAQTAADVWSQGFDSSVQEAAATLTTVKQAMGNLNQADLKTVTKQALILQQAFDVQVADSVKTAEMMTRNFGVSGQQAMDLITAGIQNGGKHASAILQTFQQYAPQFADMGVSAEAFMSQLVQGANSGKLSLDNVGQTMASLSMRIGENKGQMTEMFSELGLNASQVMGQLAQGGETGRQAFLTTLAALANVNDSTQQAQLGAQLFGEQWTAVKEGLLPVMTETSEALGQVQGSTMKAGEAMRNNFNAQVTEFWRSFQEALAPLGQVIIQLAEQWLPVLSQVIQNLSAGFQNLSPWLQNAIVIFGVLSVAISALLMFVLPLITGVLSLISLFAMLPAAFVAAIPPVLAVVAAVAALVAIGVLVYQKWDEISAFLQKAWTKIKEVAVAAWNGLLAFLKEWWQAILLGVITGGMGLIISVIVKNWDKIKALGIQAWNRIKESIGGIFTSLIEVLRSKAEALPGMISNAFGRILEFLKSMLSKMMDMGKKLMQALKEGIGNVEIPLPTFSIDFREIFPGVRVPTLDIGVKWRSLSDLVPFLEEGGIVTGPTLAMIGEGSESEAILPLSKLDHMLGSRSIHLTIEMDGETLAEKTLPHMEDQIRLQTGVTY